MEFRLEVLALFLVNIILVFTIIELNNQHKAAENLARLEIIQQRQRKLVGLTAALDHENDKLYRSILTSDLKPNSIGKIKNVDLVVSLRDRDIEPDRLVSLDPIVICPFSGSFPRSFFTRVKHRTRYVSFTKLELMFLGEKTHVCIAFYMS